MPKKRGGSSKPGAYKPTVFKPSSGRPKKAGRPGQQQVQVIVVDGTDRVPHLPSATPHVSRTKKTTPRNKESWVGQLPGTIAKFSWRYRWQLTPFVAWVVALVATAHAPVTALVVLTVFAGTAYLVARTDVGVGKRKFMSRQERLLVCYWCAGASVGAVVELLSGTWSPGRAVFVLTVAVSYPSYRWLSSRRPTRPKRKLSKKTAAMLALWSRVSKYSEGTLKGSTVVSGTASEPTDGTLVFVAQLRADVHGRSAESDVVWRKVEALLGLPPDTVRIKCDKDNATRVQVTMSSSKHLELNVVPWPGPALTSDGGVPLGDTPSGVTVVVPRYDEKGVKHSRVSGNTGNGKSTTARVLLTARASARSGASSTAATADLSSNVRYEETLWLLDGKRGTSLPEIRNVFDWYAVEDDEWPLALNAFYAALLARQLRRGKQGLSAWRPGVEVDPILTLYVSESSAVRASLLSRGLAKQYDRLVLEALQHGRALGVVVIQEAQDSVAENWLGGRRARELMSKGAAISHRPGGSTGQQYASDGASERQRLLKLPDAEGFAAVVINGRPAADVLRVRWCSEEDSRAWAESYVPRALEGDDLRAVGAAYLKRTRGREDTAADLAKVVGGEIDDTSLTISAPSLVIVPDVDARTDEELGTQTQDWLIKILSFNRGGLTVVELVERGGGKRGRSKSSIYGNLNRLKTAGKVTQDDDGKWKIT